MFNIKKMLFIPIGLTDKTKQRSTVSARGTIRNYLFQRGKEANMPKSRKFVTQNGVGLIHMQWGFLLERKQVLCCRKHTRQPSCIMKEMSTFVSNTVQCHKNKNPTIPSHMYYNTNGL